MAESQSGIRASDADRERIATIIRAASGEGLLTLEEADERLASVYAAKYIRDLEPLTSDLPDGGLPLIGERPRAGQRPHRSGDRPGPPWGERRLSWHAFAVGAIAVTLIAAWAVSGAHFFWPIWPIAFLVFGWFRHAGRGHGRC